MHFDLSLDLKQSFYQDRLGTSMSRKSSDEKTFLPAGEGWSACIWWSDGEVSSWSGNKAAGPGVGCHRVVPPQAQRPSESDMDSNLIGRRQRKCDIIAPNRFNQYSKAFMQYKHHDDIVMTPSLHADGQHAMSKSRSFS